MFDRCGGKKWLFWFYEALACVSGKTKCVICAAVKTSFFLCVGKNPVKFVKTSLYYTSAWSVASRHRFTTNVLGIPSNGIRSTYCSTYYQFSSLAFTFNLPLNPLLGIAFVSGSVFYFSSAHLFVFYY
jgi:hypothetical protein